MGISLRPLSGLDRLRAMDAEREPVKKKTGLQRLQEIDQDSQVENRGENIWDALGVGDEVKRTGQGQVTAQMGMPDKGEKEYARQFVTGRDASGKPFDMIGENIKLQQNPELADRVARHIAEIKAENTRQPGFIQRHVDDWEHAQNPNIVGGQRTDVTGYDPQGFPMREPVQQFAQKNPIVQPDEPNAQTMPEYQHGAATALGDIANIGFAGDMAGSMAAEKVAQPLIKSFAKRVLKSGAQGAAINAPLSAADQALNNPNHLQGALEGAATGAIGGFALGAGGHAALEGIAGGLNKLRALDGMVQRANPVALQTAGGAAAGAVGGAYTADEGHKLEGAGKGALLGGAAGYAHGKYEGRIPGLSTEDATPPLKSPNAPVFFSRLDNWLDRQEQQIGKKPKPVEFWENFFYKKGGDFAPKEAKIRVGHVLDALKQKPDAQISFDDMKQLLKSNPIKIKARVIGAELPHGQDPVKIPAAEERVARARDANLTFLANHLSTRETLDDVLANPGHPHHGEAAGIYSEWESAIEALKKARREGSRVAPRGYEQLGGDPRYEAYTEPGGDDYREVVISTRAPGVEVPRSGYLYDEHHYGKSGEGIADVMGHVRFKRRFIDGKKTLQIEEAQSQLGQDAAKSGFQDDPEVMRVEADRERRSFHAFNESRDAHNDWMRARTELAHNDPELARLEEVAREKREAHNDLVAEIANTGKAVPRLPLVDDQGEYTRTILAHALDIAAREGHEKIIWTPGGLQSERYANSLQAKADRLHYDPKTQELTPLKANRPVQFPDGSTSAKVSPSQLPDMIGEENAQKLLAATPKAWKGKLVQILKGEDYTVGSKGMTKYYNEVIPATMKKLARQQGVEIEVRPHEVADAAKSVPAPDVAIGKHASEMGRERNLSKEIEKAMDGSRYGAPGFEVAMHVRGAGNEAAIRAVGRARSLAEESRTLAEVRHDAIVKAVKELSPIERDQLTAFTGQDFWNIDDIAQHGHEFADYTSDDLMSKLYSDSDYYAADAGAKDAIRSVLGAMKRGKNFREAVETLRPERREDVADFLGESLFSPSHPTGEAYVSKAPVMHGFDRPPELGMKPFPLYSNPIGPALRNIYGKPLTGAVVGGTVGGLEDKEDRTRGVLAGAGIGAAAGSLGAKGGARAALRDLYQMPEVRLAADFERTFQGLRTGYRKAFVTPFAGMEKSYPELATRLNADAGAFKNAEHIGRRQTEWVTEGLSDPQKEQFGKKLVLDNLEAEETRKLQAANDTQQHVHTLRQGAAALTTQANTEYQYAESLRRQGLHVQAKAAERVAATLEKEASANIHQAVDLEAQATELRDAAGHFKEHADKLRPEVQPKVEDEPWFKDALAKHNQFIAPDLQEAAINAGVAPGSLRQPSSAYVRLFSEERLRNRQIRRAQDLAIQKPEAAKARNRLFKTLIGEKPERARVLPPGATDPMEGPRNPLVESTATDSSRPVEGASRTGSSKMARGTAERYVTDYKTLVHEDARDKVTRGTRNAVYDELANGAGRLLRKGEEPGPGLVAVQRYIKLPSGDLEAQRFEVTPEVKRVFDQWEHERNVQDYEGSRFRRLAGIFTKAQISGMPVEATSHANTLASIVASVPGEKDATGKVLSGIPMIGAKAAAIREMNAIDFASEATRSLEKRLARAGALRIEEPSGGDEFAFFHGKGRTSLAAHPSRINEFADERHGLLSSAHHWLFGPEGIDVRGRLVLARKYLDRKPNATDKELFEFVTGKLGNYNRASSGRAINALQDSQFSAFGRFQGARIPTAVKSLAGQSGLPANSIGQKLGDVANTLYRGPVGYGIGAQAANYAMTGHSTFENEPGHHFDVQLGNPFTQHAAEAGPDDRPVYLPFATTNPVTATGARATGALAALDPKGWKRSPLEVMTGPVNTALGVASPFVRGMWSGITGTAPYMEPNGTFLQTAATRFSPSNTLGERLHEGVVHMNPALAAFAGSGGDPGGRTLAGALSDGTRFGGGPGAMAARAAEFLLPRIVNPGVGGRDNPSSRDFVESATYREALRQWTNQARRQPNIDSFETVSDEALKDMKDAGYDDEAIDKVLQTLEKAWQNRDKTREDAARRAEQLNDRLRER